MSWLRLESRNPPEHVIILVVTTTTTTTTTGKGDKAKVYGCFGYKGVMKLFLGSGV